MNDTALLDSILRNLKAQNDQLNRLLGNLSDEQLTQEIAPGKNTGVYLLGHIIAANEGMLTLFGAGDKMYPELEMAFLRTPDKSGQDMPSPATLREMWAKSSAAMQELFTNLPAEEWTNRHTAVSEADFANEPHRNKINVLLSRLLHQAYHVGQIALLK